MNVLHTPPPIDPTADPDELAKFAAIAEQWWDPEGKFKPLHRINPLRLQYVRDHICTHLGRDAEQEKPLEGLKLLDVGCGGGLLCEPLARMGASVTGIDATEKNVRIAALHAEQSGLPIDYRHISAEALVEAGERFDAVLSLEVVEHVADVERFIAACCALVKPKGQLFLSTINRTAKSYALAIVGAEYILRWLPRGTHDWHRFLKPSELTAYVEKSGFHVKHMAGMNMHPMTWEWSLSERDVGVNYLLAAER